MNSLEFVKLGIAICENQKAIELKVYDIGNDSSLADYCMVCSGNSLMHIRALSQHLNRKFKDSGILPRNIEGNPASQWILMDYQDVIMHLFLHDLREYYNIENLFDESKIIYPWPD